MKSIIPIIVFFIILALQYPLSAKPAPTRIDVIGFKKYHAPINWLLSLSDLKNLSTELRVPWPKEMAESLTATSATLTYTINPKKPLPLSPPRQRNNELLIDIPIPSRLYLGSARLVRLTLQQKERAPRRTYLVPLNAVGGFGKTDTFLLVENQGTIERTSCVVLESFRERAVVLAAVPPSARLITAGQEKIYFSKEFIFHEVKYELN